MQKSVVALLLLLLLGAASGQTASASDLSEDVDDVDGDGEFVMGREIKSNFTYKINNPYQPIDTAFALDGSGSMGSNRNDVASATKNYIDNANTDKGDKIAVAELGDKLQTLTSDKSAAKNAADYYWENSQSSCIACGVTRAKELLDSGSNPIQVMVVLADAQSSDDPGDEADAARAAGIEVHGIMYPGAKTSFFESMTEASQCKMDTSENDDGDKCWYAASDDTVNQVYSAIQEEVTAETSADLHMVLPDHAIPISSYDSSTDLSGPYTRYTRNNVNSSAGYHSEIFRWYPGEEGSTDVKTGESYLTLDVEGSTKTYYFDDKRTEDVKYVDLNVSETNVSRVEDTVYINVTLRNKGNIVSKERYLKIYDEDGYLINRTIPPISAGGSYLENFSVGANHNVFQDADRISAHFDFRGVFDSLPVGEGQILEPDEQNNKKSLGYPVALESTSPDKVEWNDTFRFTLDFSHYYPDTVQGTYDLYKNGTLIRDDVSYNKPSEGVLRTNWIDNNDSRIWYNITSEIVGPYGAHSVYRHSYYVRNPRPEIYASEPKNLNPAYGDPVQLRAYVDDENNVENLNDLTVKIYNQDTGQLLKEETGVSPRTSVTYDWANADKAGKIYRWNVTVSDRWHTISEVFRFRRATRNSYRTQTQSEYSYSGVITSSGSPGNFRYTVRNPLDFDKTGMETKLSGVNAHFPDGSASKSYSLPSDSSKTFNIIVSPDESTTGQQYLTITTINHNLGINNTDKIPVYVRKDAKRSFDVPGLGVLQLVALLASSAAVFFRGL
ncbi:VWA domain-containing protein [Candidatus Nanohaloarchaea archaeon]|nr:VWA domain-containing protein [Candidatus Nanohaloarchaea archaeon]